ncbi:MAG: hypothetical protein DI585_00625 [Pseudomonas fluorescens]|nr:MAG: hypothetical protein DI585_00625 [Pseudomonas fluorescens]
MTETPNNLDPLTADAARFQKLSSDPVEQISPKPTRGFAHLNSAEMVAEPPVQARSIGKPSCGWTTPKIYNINEAMMLL